MKLILLGPPGAGKGTQAVRLSKEYGWIHISTGDMLRDAVAKGAELGKKAKSFMDAGELVPDDIINKIVVERIKDIPGSTGFILDGYPRTEAQAQRLQEALEDLGQHIDKVIYFKTSPAVSIKRLSGRRVCRECGANFHVNNIPPRKEGICDKCGGGLFQRPDDKEETVRNRLNVYEEQTKKLLAFYEKKKVLIPVSGDLDVDGLFGELSGLFKKENLV